MDNNYFESLKNSVQEQPNSTPVESSGMAILTVKVDVDCKLYCDGDFLDLFEANKVKKVQIPTGQHLMTIESEHYEGLSEDQVVEANESGKNYLLMIKGMKEKEDSLAKIQQEKEQKEAEALKKAQELESVLNGSDKINVKMDKSIPLNRDDLAYLFGKILISTPIFSADIDKAFYDSIPNENRKGSNLADKIADCLLFGGSVVIYDNRSNGDISPGMGFVTLGTKYTINISDVVDGLSKAANGTYITNNDSEWVSDCFSAFEQGDEAGFGQEEADCLMQIILFNELIYG